MSTTAESNAQSSASAETAESEAITAGLTEIAAASDSPSKLLEAARRAEWMAKDYNAVKLITLLTTAVEVDTAAKVQARAA